MSSFKDLANNQFEMKITIGACDRIKSLTGVDLLDDEGASTILTNPRLAIAVLCAAIKPQLDVKSITPEAFLDLLDGDAQAAGVDALMEAIVNFTRPEFRATRQKLVEKIKETNLLQAEREAARLPQIDRLIAAEMNKSDRDVNSRVEKKIAELSGVPQDASA